MSDNKTYYYMRLKEHFFDSDELVMLENMPKGYIYSNILLKLYLKSLKRNGKLMLSDTMPYNVDILAKVIRHNVKDVKTALEIFKELGLVEIIDNGAIYMTKIQNYIGKSSTEADRKRQYREQIERDKCPDKSQDKGEDKTEDKCPDKSTPEIEIEKDIDLDIRSCAFETFWNAYPKKKAKAAAEKAFKRIKVDDTLLTTMLSALEIQKRSKQWQDKQFIPYPATWLNQRRWEDEMDETPKETLKQTDTGLFKF